MIVKSSPPAVFLRNAVLKICSKFTGEQSCRKVILAKSLCNFEITLRHECPPVNLLHIFSKVFYNNTYGGLLLYHQLASYFVNKFFQRCQNSEEKFEIFNFLQHTIRTLSLEQNLSVVYKLQNAIGACILISCEAFLKKTQFLQI